MARKYFGTDGIRGLTNMAPMTAAMAMKVGMAAGAHFVRGDHKHRVVIGKDTRLSGYMLENALVAGFTSVGMDVTLFGPLPTPAIGMLTKSMRADLGVMISASHNPFADNGIKLFGPDGYKLSDADELAIEALIDGDVALAAAPDIGRARRVEDARGRYIHFAKATFPDDLTLDGLKIVVDCANGAAYQVAPSALWELGADVIAIGVTPNGKNINDQVGSTAPQTLCETVVASGADIGIALDGDADRLIVVDETGRVIDGDQLMAVIATGWARAGNLRNGGLVATVMSNLGLERHLAAQGIKLIRFDFKQCVPNLHRLPILEIDGVQKAGDARADVHGFDRLDTSSKLRGTAHLLNLDLFDDDSGRWKSLPRSRLLSEGNGIDARGRGGGQTNDHQASADMSGHPLLNRTMLPGCFA